MDWAYHYKVLLILTAIFHPVGHIRGYAFYYSVALFTFGTLNTYIDNGYYWFMVSTTREMVCILLTLMIIGNRGIGTFLILQGIVFAGLNIHQMLGWYEGSVFYDSFLSTKQYIYYNKWGFEILLFCLWMRDDVFKALRQGCNFNNVTMCYILMCIAYFAGEY